MSDCPGESTRLLLMQGRTGRTLEELRNDVLKSLYDDWFRAASVRRGDPVFQGPQERKQWREHE